MTTVTIGIDLGDKNHEVCVLDNAGEVIDRFMVGNTKSQLQKVFAKYAGALVAMETGTHSPWVSRVLVALGCRVLVGNARKLRAIWASSQKSDTKDAEMLARIARLDPKLLYPIRHRSQKAQVDLEQIKARDLLVRLRTDLINHVRGVVKSLGERLSKCAAPAFHKKVQKELPDDLRTALIPLLEQIGSLTGQIRAYDKQLEDVAETAYPETVCLRQIQGVGLITALAYILTLESPDRFDKSRAVGPHLGLTPRKDQSGSSDKQLRISKEGDVYLRRLLVSCAQYILGPFGQDSDLRRYGERLIARGGRAAKRKAVVAVARKLGILLHHLWSTGEVYQPLHNAKPAA
ncbi:MAG: IS110 family transposase [Planctomycetes bacterium]|nr:IS110 family transposase [Planctomycetota bacterium]